MLTQIRYIVLFETTVSAVNLLISVSLRLMLVRVRTVISGIWWALAICLSVCGNRLLWLKVQSRCEELMRPFRTRFSTDMSVAVISSVKLLVYSVFVAVVSGVGRLVSLLLRMFRVIDRSLMHSVTMKMAVSRAVPGIRWPGLPILFEGTSVALMLVQVKTISITVELTVDYVG